LSGEFDAHAKKSGRREIDQAASLKSKLITATSTPVIESPVREENRLNIGRKYAQEKLQEIEAYLAGLKRVKSVGPAVPPSSANSASLSGAATGRKYNVADVAASSFNTVLVVNLETNVCPFAKVSDG
jgi:hypothetical protein